MYWSKDLVHNDASNFTAEMSVLNSIAGEGQGNLIGMETARARFIASSHG